MAVRINTKISERANEWLDSKAKEMALTKSALINIAIENYIKESEVTQGLPKIVELLEQNGIKLK